MRKIKFVVGKFYHLFNRGVDKRDIFLEDRDRWRFLQGLFLFNDKEKFHNILYRLETEKGALNFNVLRDFIKKKSPTERNQLIRIVADCLMPNHFHLIVEEINDNGISEFMHRSGIGYTKCFNKKYLRSGSLFESTFKAVPIENDEYLKYLLVYINVINPGQLIEPDLKEKGVKNINAIIDFAENYDWSTNKEYLGTRESVIIDKGLLGEIFYNPEEYRKFIKETLLNKKYKEINHLILE